MCSAQCSALLLAVAARVRRIFVHNVQHTHWLCTVLYAGYVMIHARSGWMESVVQHSSYALHRQPTRNISKYAYALAAVVVASQLIFGLHARKRALCSGGRLCARCITRQINI